jgi:hypothetical protein
VWQGRQAADAASVAGGAERPVNVLETATGRSFQAAQAPIQAIREDGYECLASACCRREAL